MEEENGRKFITLEWRGWRVLCNFWLCVNTSRMYLIKKYDVLEYILLITRPGRLFKYPICSLFRYYETSWKANFQYVLLGEKRVGWGAARIPNKIIYSYERAAKVKGSYLDP